MKTHELTTVNTATTMSKQTLTITNKDEAQEDKVIDTDAKVGQFMLTLKCKGKKTIMYRGLIMR